VTEIIISAVLGTIGFFAVMFRSEIKAKIVGHPAARRAKKYDLAMKGDLSARRWCREKLSDEQREEYYEAVREDAEKLWHVMWACTSPEYFGQEGTLVKRRFMVLA